MGAKCKAEALMLTHRRTWRIVRPMTWLIPFDIELRRRASAPGGQWHALAESLLVDLGSLTATEAPVPATKARLTRRGGRCSVDGSLLLFDPWSPYRHRCPACGRVFGRDEDHDWWAMGASLWSAERAVHAALLHLLGHGRDTLRIAVSILGRFADQYLRWPNKDNVLGPSRPFFSTYLESIWLLNICQALSLLELSLNVPGDREHDAEGIATVGRQLRDRLISPSLELISSFDEGLSNRQVWNEAAILSALCMLGDEKHLERRMGARSRVTQFLRDGLLNDGSWYEGENYHLFAHRGLWYIVQLLDCRGIDIEARLRVRYRRGFIAPFVGLLPDDTFPSRKDSQYRISIHQWRFAEWCELALAEEYSGLMAGMRDWLYRSGLPGRGTGRSASTADAERNDPPSALSPADCGWRTLLVGTMDTETLHQRDDATAGAPSTLAIGAPAGHLHHKSRVALARNGLGESTPGGGPFADTTLAASVLMEEQGLAIIRRAHGSVYVSLDGGADAGGHGHPDGLNLTLQTGEHRFLDDPGTGSYTDPRLHWYRSTLAHHAPLADRRSQSFSGDTTRTELLAFEDRGAFGWMSKRARLSERVTAVRTVTVCDGYLVDLLEWSVTDDGVMHEITLPICAGAVVRTAEVWAREAAHPPSDAQGKESPSLGTRPPGIMPPGTWPVSPNDGFPFATDVEVCEPGPLVELGMLTLAESLEGAKKTREANKPRLLAWFMLPPGAQLVSARVPAPPGYPGTIPRHWLRIPAPSGGTGRIVSCISWESEVGSDSHAPGYRRHERHPAVISVTPGPGGDSLCTVVTGDGLVSRHSFGPGGWHIDLEAGGSRSSVDLALKASEDPDERSVHELAEVSGFRSSIGHAKVDDFTAVRGEAEVDLSGTPFVRTLGRHDYLRTEETWEEAGAPTATLCLEVSGESLVLTVEADGPAVVPPAGTENPLDNERADVNAAGVQLYVTAKPGDPWLAGWLAVPADPPRVAVLEGDLPVKSVRAERTTRGWRLRLEVPIEALHRLIRRDGPDGVDVAYFSLAIDAVVNERPPHRERRRGQLVLSGGTGFAYLRGDRHSSAHALRFRLPGDV